MQKITSLLFFGILLALPCNAQPRLQPEVLTFDIKTSRDRSHNMSLTLKLEPKGTVYSVTANLPSEDRLSAYYTSLFHDGDRLSPVSASHTIIAGRNSHAEDYSWTTPKNIKMRSITSSRDETVYSGDICPVRDIINLLYWLRIQPYDGMTLPPQQAIVVRKSILPVTIQKYERRRIAMPMDTMDAICVTLNFKYATYAKLYISDDSRRLPLAFLARLGEETISGVLSSDKKDSVVKGDTVDDLAWFVQGITTHTKKSNTTKTNTMPSPPAPVSNGVATAISAAASSLNKMAAGIEQLNNALAL